MNPESRDNGRTWPPVCALCHREMVAPGAILLSPPLTNNPVEGIVVRKEHICGSCYGPVREAMFALTKRKRDTPSDGRAAGSRL